MDLAAQVQGIVGEKVFHGPGGVEAATREFFEAWEQYTLRQRSSSTSVTR